MTFYALRSDQFILVKINLFAFDIINATFIQWTKAAVRRCSVEKVFLEISQNSHENTCARVSFLIKLQARPTTLLKRLWHRCFPVNFAKFLRIPFFTGHLWWLLLNGSYYLCRLKRKSRCCHDKPCYTRKCKVSLDKILQRINKISTTNFDNNSKTCNT